VFARDVRIGDARLVTQPYIAVVGSGLAARETDALAEEVGALLARGGAVVVCGGLDGVMEAVCRGAKNAGGTTVGLLPSSDRRDANEFVDVAIPTGMGEMRNALVVRSADAVIAIGGGWGTLSEIAFAMKLGKRVVGLRTWNLAEALPPAAAGDGFAAVITVSSPDEAVRAALHAV